MTDIMLHYAGWSSDECYAFPSWSVTFTDWSIVAYISRVWCWARQLFGFGESFIRFTKWTCLFDDGGAIKLAVLIAIIGCVTLWYYLESSCFILLVSFSICFFFWKCWWLRRVHWFLLTETLQLKLTTPAISPGIIPPFSLFLSFFLLHINPNGFNCRYSYFVYFSFFSSSLPIPLSLYLNLVL